jgi:hypothetical protein
MGSNTDSNSPRPGQFRKGDPRINRKGRPRSFDALRELALMIAHERTGIVVDGHGVTVAEAILRQWAQSKNPHLQRAFIEIAFGKVPDKIHLSTDEIIVQLATDSEISDED